MMEQVNLTCMYIENDLEEERHRATTEERDRLQMLGSCPTRLRLDHLGPNVAWARSKASMAIIACNYEGDVGWILL